jgi:cytochrome c553
LSVWGDGRRRVQACNNCHGPDGSGEPPVFPYLAGLDARYLQTALTEWRNGTRDNDATKQMPFIAKALTEEDLASLSQYYAAMRPPKPVVATLTRSTPGRTPPKPAPSSTPATVEQQGGGSSPGVGQGAATGGGSQGPGGSGDSRRR